MGFSYNTIESVPKRQSLNQRSPPHLMKEAETELFYCFSLL
jgi:hypothetical protein